MKNKERKFSRLGICFIIFGVLFASSIIILIIRPDYRFRTKEFVLSFSNSVNLDELDKNDFDYETMSIKDAEKKDYVIDQSMMLVNVKNCLNDDLKPQIRQYKQTGVVMNKCVVSAYNQLSNDVKKNTDEKLLIMSSYRTAKEQEEIEKEQGDDTALPKGASEHQTGLGLDVYFDKFAGYGILKCDAGRYLNENCWKSGFIIRYPVGKKSSTGIDFEPWHIRYVGKDAAKEIYEHDLTLEQYLRSKE